MSRLRAISCVALRAAAWAALLCATFMLAPGIRSANAAAEEPPFHITANNMTGGREPSGDVLYLNGDIRVTRGKTLLTADAGRYLRATGMIDLNGHVKLVDSTTTVTCEHAQFSENDDRLNLDGNVVIVDKTATLRAPTGWYDRKNGLAHLSGGVTGSEKLQRLSADEVTYLRDSLLVQARGRVKGFDDENKVELSARSVDFYRKTKIAVATGDPEMRSKDTDGQTSILRARLLRVDSDAKTAEAIDSVTVERDTLRARADRAFFDDRQGRGLMLGSPRAYDNETSVSGDTLELLSDNHKLRKVVVHSNATMDYLGRRETNSGETSRLSGARIEAYVVEDRIDSLRATGAARNGYSSPSKAGKTNETNQASGDTILVYFKDKKIDRARVIGTASGEYRPSVAKDDTTAVINEVVRYDGKKIDFVVPKNTIVLDGDAHLTYREMELTAKRVEFDSDKQTLVATGKPQLQDRGDKVDGHLMSYDMQTRTGTIYQAQTAYEKGLYRGQRIRKAGDNELDVLGGSYSTCDLDEPHYHFSARWMKIYLKDKLVAKPVVFYLRNVPIFALPFYVFPIKPGRHSGFLFPQFELGFNNKSGQFLRNAGYYWAPNDYFDLTGAADYYQAAPSYAIRGEGNYKLLYRFDGHFEGRFEHNDATGRDDYVFDGTHQQDVTPRTRLTAQGNFVSSRDYNNSAFSGATLEQRLNRFLRSNISISHSADWAAFNAVIDRNQDLDADQSIVYSSANGASTAPAIGQRASLANLSVSSPNLSVSFPTRTLGSYAFLKDRPLGKALQTTYFSLNTQFLSQSTRQAFVKNYLVTNGGLDSSTVLDQQVLTRRGFRTNVSISDSRRAFGWLNIAPGVNATGVVFDFDEQGRKVVPAAVWSSQLSMSSTFYGTFKPPIPKLVGLRHVIAPALSFSYSPDFSGLQYTDTAGVRRNRFNGFGGISISGFKSANMNFSLDQRFQVKLKDHDQVTRLDNLLSMTTSGSYNFLYQEAHQKHGLSALFTNIRLQPPGLLSADAAGSVDVYEGRPLRTFGYNLGANFSSNGAKKTPASLPVDQTARKGEITSADDFKENWRMSLAYSYSGGYAGPSWSAQKTANAVVSYAFSPNWQFDYSTSYDVTRSQVVSQRYSLTRHIHCWEAIFTRSFTPGGEAEYYFRLGIRDQREIYIERGTRVQSFGGIQ